MDTKKLNTLFLKYQLGNKKTYIDSVDDKYIITDSYCVYIINKDNLFLNTSKFKEVNIKNLLEKTPEVEYKDSGIVKDKKYMIFKSESGTELTINKDLLTPFDLNKCEFKASESNKEPLYIYSLGELVGICLPIVTY